MSFKSLVSQCRRRGQAVPAFIGHRTIANDNMNSRRSSVLAHLSSLFHSSSFMLNPLYPLWCYVPRPSIQVMQSNSDCYSCFCRILMSKFIPNFLPAWRAYAMHVLSGRRVPIFNGARNGNGNRNCAAGNNAVLNYVFWPNYDIG